LRDIYFVNADTGYAVGANGTILKTTSGGFVNVENKDPEPPGFTIYPNPAREKIVITPGKKSPGKFILTITSLMGKQAIRKEFQDQGSYELDVSSLHEGIYIINIQTASGSAFKKLIIK
jgi:hypothetical protein